MSESAKQSVKLPEPAVIRLTSDQLIDLMNDVPVIVTFNNRIMGYVVPIVDGPTIGKPLTREFAAQAWYQYLREQVDDES